MSSRFEIKDSGERRDFDTGAKRDVDEDKPRFDLIPVTVLQNLCSMDVLDKFHPEFLSGEANPTIETITNNINNDTKAEILSLGFSWGCTVDDGILFKLIWICLEVIRYQEGDELLLCNRGKAYQMFAHRGLHMISPKTYLRLANHYGGGAKKYDPWNWSKGMPLSVFHASLMRHIFAIIENKTDEDHWSAIFFNTAAILHFRIIKRKDVDDVTPRIVEWEKTLYPTKKPKID